MMGTKGKSAMSLVAGHLLTQPDGVVLLSPAAPSFGQFPDYRDRGGAFGRAMRAMRAIP